MVNRELTNRRLLLAGGVGAVVLALVAGLLAWLASSPPTTPDRGGGAQNREPFEQALVALAEEPGLRYADRSRTGSSRHDITVTPSGMQFGETGSAAGARKEILTAGGRTYSRWKHDPAPPPAGDGKKRAAKAPGRWTVGFGGGSAFPADAADRYPAPRKLATLLGKALKDVRRLPEPHDPPLAVNGVPALAADTSAGRILVARQPPYRVLRLEPYEPNGPSGLLDRLKGAVGGPPKVRRATTGPLLGGDSDGVDLSPVPGAAVPGMYDRLARDVGQLADAIDPGVGFSLDSAGKLNCGHGGCSVQQRFTGKLSTAARTRVTGGTLTAALTATISIDGRYAGRCGSRGTFPVQGTAVSGSLSCSSPEAGAVFSSVDAQHKARARAQSRAQGGGIVRYTISSRASTLIEARVLAVAEVQRLVRQVHREGRDARCPAAAGAPGAKPAVAKPVAYAASQAGAGDCRAPASYERVAASLPRRVDRGPTAGQVVDKAGNRIGGVMTSGRTASTRAIDTFLKSSPHAARPRAGAEHTAATHVETKIAWRMREHGITHADVVINNSGGVCRGPFSCDQAVRAILPRGSTMTVWYPTPSGLVPFTITGVG
ncbi:DddA-like double-stranded DNA deaminase toxin [Streptomyces coeruleoprunus]|uniref:DddA-like double-stranded DNA deaminase toxin n=1 Tax=Streptomyces coeruleoprunus TaxID=285563 RepID=A0ABV9XBM1_9ACTN